VQDWLRWVTAVFISIRKLRFEVWPDDEHGFAVLPVFPSCPNSSRTSRTGANSHTSLNFEFVLLTGSRKYLLNSGRVLDVTFAEIS
jgi:hypothetical protein